VQTFFCERRYIRYFVVQEEKEQEKQQGDGQQGDEQQDDDKQGDDKQGDYKQKIARLSRFESLLPHVQACLTFGEMRLLILH
jgi:hypothetical protein